MLLSVTAAVMHLNISASTIRKYGKSGKAVDTKFDEVTIKIVDWWFYVRHEVCHCICSSGDSQQLSTTMMSEWAMIDTIDLNSFNGAWPKRVLNDMYKTGCFRRKLHLIYHVPVPKEVSKIPLSHKSLKRLYTENMVFGVEYRIKTAPDPHEVLLSQMKFKINIDSWINRKWTCFYLTEYLLYLNYEISNYYWNQVIQLLILKKG